MLNFLKATLLYALFWGILMFIRHYDLPPLANKHHNEVFLALNWLSIGAACYCFFDKEKSEIRQKKLSNFAEITIFILILLGIHFVLKLLVLETVAYILLAILIIWGIKRYKNQDIAWRDQFIVIFLVLMVIDKGFLLQWCHFC